MQNTLSIKIKDLVKIYDLGKFNFNFFFSGLKSNNSQEKLIVLDNVNIEIYQGEKIGIIGHNGAGKSTLLKIISRITFPTSGYVEIHGNVASVLEAGIGFHHELSGIENIYLNGALLGMTRGDIQKKISQIIEFSELDKYIKTPLKRYSTGMLIKLAFSICVFLKSDILILDEILAVVDQYFREKSINEIIKSVNKENRTLLFVSHQLENIEQLCDKVILLEKGKVTMFDDTKKVLQLYKSKLEKDHKETT